MADASATPQIRAVRSRAQLEIAVRALDRVLMHGHYVIPQWYSGTHRVAYWNRFGFPAKDSGTIGIHASGEGCRIG